MLFKDRDTGVHTQMMTPHADSPFPLPDEGRTALHGAARAGKERLGARAAARGSRCERAG